jgi:quercetin dioxygenase-like cupin family protein
MNEKQNGSLSVPYAAILNDMVEYQTGSIVSRTLISKPSGSVTLFSFDAGESLSEHTAPFDAMVNIIDGEAQVNIAGKQHAVRAGETIVMPAGQPHALQAVKRFKMLLIMIMS